MVSVLWDCMPSGKCLKSALFHRNKEKRRCTNMNKNNDESI
nr:MAG TPA: hypothetical protein [Caudoviricetes sp.]